MAEPIRFFDRASRTVKTEEIYGERWLRFAYEFSVGRFFVWLLARRKIFSTYYGWKMGRRYSALQILPFITKYNIDVDEFAKSPFDFKTFNEFFYRSLKPSARPIAPGERVAVFPADARHLILPNVETSPGFYVKGATFSLAELFHNPFPPDETSVLAKTFEGGSAVISRLCPTDYHRFHFPVDGVPSAPQPIEGYLYSVSPVALRHYLKYLVQNKRVVTRVESPIFGTVAMIEIGATNVGTIRQTHPPGRAVKKGDEKGFFAFGGSCVITLFQRGRLRFDQDLVDPSRPHMEVYARMGERMGEAP